MERNALFVMKKKTKKELFTVQPSCQRSFFDSSMLTWKKNVNNSLGQYVECSLAGTKKFSYFLVSLPVIRFKLYLLNREKYLISNRPPYSQHTQPLHNKLWVIGVKYIEPFQRNFIFVVIFGNILLLPMKTNNNYLVGTF